MKISYHCTGLSTRQIHPFMPTWQAAIGKESRIATVETSGLPSHLHLSFTPSHPVLLATSAGLLNLWLCLPLWLPACPLDWHGTVAWRSVLSRTGLQPSLVHFSLVSLGNHFPTQGWALDPKFSFSQYPEQTDPRHPWDDWTMWVNSGHLILRCLYSPGCPSCDGTTITWEGCPSKPHLKGIPCDVSRDLKYEKAQRRKGV